MAELIVKTHIQWRDTLGRYLATIDEKARRSIEETAKGSAEVGRAMATVKSGAMRATVQAVIFSDWNGGVTVGTDHWKYQEDGTSAHSIPGNVSFFWENEGRMWEAGDNTISHPGNPAVHFMLAASEYAKSHLMDAVRRNFG